MPLTFKKKMMASARTKVNLSKKARKKQDINHNDGSFLDESIATGSNQVILEGTIKPPVPLLCRNQADQQILSLLQDLKISPNCTLFHRIKRLERNVSISSTPLESPQSRNKVSHLPRSGYVAHHTIKAPPQEPQSGFKIHTSHATVIPPMERIRWDAGISAAVL